jgi:hypothetical protein
VQSLFSPGPGETVNNWVNSRMGRARTIAVRNAPQRSGELMFSHLRNGFRRIGRYEGSSSLINTAPHAEYVHEGTKGSKAKGKKFLIVPRMSVTYSVSRAASLSSNLTRNVRKVRGQAANPWLADAVNEAFRE